MDNKSFSLQFNPLMNVKCVKDYEDEIANLKAENFELKAQLTHSNIPKVLYENKQEMESLLAQKQELENNMENLKRVYESLAQEKRLLENKYNQDISLSNEKQSLLEDENKRLLLRLEKLNKEIQDAPSMKHELNNTIEQMNSLRETIQNMEKRDQQMQYEIESFRRQAEEEIKSKNFEIENLRKKLEITIQREKNSSFIISDLKSALNTQIKEKSMLEEAKVNESELRNLLEVAQREKKELIESVQKEHTIYLNGMEKFKKLILEKLAGITTSLVGLNERISQIKMFAYVSEENKAFISKINVRCKCINDLIVFFKEKHADLYKKLDSLKQETAVGQRAAMDKKMQAILLEFRNQFNEAKNELIVCKKYLEKKAAENKALKTENARLSGEIMKRTQKYNDIMKV